MAEAEPLLRRAITIDVRPDHPDFAVRLNNLGLLLHDTNRLAEAEPLYRRALGIEERSFGPNHPDVAARLNNLAQLLQATNRMSEAELSMRRAIAIVEKSVGPDHPDVGFALNTLAVLLQATNRLTESERLHRRALAIREKRLGPEHPNVATDVNNLARLLHASNRLSEAEPLYRRALAINEVSLGPGHPKVGNSLTNLAWLLAERDDWAAAAALGRRAKPILIGRGDADGEALVLFLDVPQFGNLPGETLIWVVPKADARWARIELASRALAERAAALRCGLDRGTWEGEGRRRCLDLLAVDVEKAPDGRQPLPFDLTHTHQLYQALFGARFYEGKKWTHPKPLKSSADIVELAVAGLDEVAAARALRVAIVQATGYRL